MADSRNIDKIKIQESDPEKKLQKNSLLSEPKKIVTTKTQ